MVHQSRNLIDPGLPNLNRRDPRKPAGQFVALDRLTRDERDENTAPEASYNLNAIETGSFIAFVPLGLLFSLLDHVCPATKNCVSDEGKRNHAGRRSKATLRGQVANWPC